MIYFQLKIRFPAGAVLTGGDEAASGIAAQHTRDAQGRPIILSTAVRGALRMTLEALLRGAGQHVCDDGKGRTKNVENAGSCHCDACRLFGTAQDGMAKDENYFSALELSDAVLPGSAGDYEWVTRTGVGIDRKRRAASERLLFTVRLPALTPEHYFVADGVYRGSEAEPLWQKFNAAVFGTTHLGSGQSRGLGRVDLTLEPRPAPSLVSFSLPAEGDLQLKVTLTSPACLATPISDSNLVETRTDISGATLRGAIGFAASRLVAEGRADQKTLDRLVDEKTGAIFDFATVYNDAKFEQPGWPGAMPATFRRSKTDGKWQDSLCCQLRVATNQGDLSLPEGKYAPRARTGGFEPDQKLLRTRISMNRKRFGAEDGQLFSMELLPEGTCFVGSIRRIPPEARALLEQALQQPLAVGKGLSRGWGKIKLEVSSPSLTDLKTRKANFQKDFGDETLLAWTLLTPLVLEQSPSNADRLSVDDGSQAIIGALQLDSASVHWVYKVRYFDIEGVWVQKDAKPEDQRDRRMHVVQAGAVYVAQIKNAPADLEERLARLEQDGVGRRTHQGFGRLLTFDPLYNYGAKR